jgi:EAL domain-containing protein (putative c-di-GMP-specific phosphodiesterase class I)
MEHIEDNEGPARIAQRIIDQMKTPFVLDGRQAYISTSIGIAISTSSRTRPDSILREADIALYQAKAAGKDRFMFFNPSMNTEVGTNGASAARLEMESDLRRALENEEFRLYYQPKIDLTSGRIVGVEALTRWQHPERGLILPGEFLPVAEESSTILDIDRWVMEEACQQVQEWGRQFPSLPPLRVSVNMNAREFHDPLFIERIADVLDKTHMSPNLLELEGTEKILASSSATTIRTIETLRTLGIGLALDDFGAGSSSLGPLWHLPVTTLKIDRSFVQEISNDERIRPILEAMTTLSHALGAQVVAAGIETGEQLAHMRKMRCDFGQGFYFAKPVPPEGISTLLGGDRPQAAAFGPVLQPQDPRANGHNGKH